ncbi:hypothetical protein [Seonamhaeicola sp. S2-3]|nr:hypothetical protein [Seonamhaeicola sp. S2-3]
MKNLESFGVQELNKKEMKDFNGGFLAELLAAAIFITAGILLKKHFGPQ